GVTSLAAGRVALVLLAGLRGAGSAGGAGAVELVHADEHVAGDVELRRGIDRDLLLHPVLHLFGALVRQAGGKRRGLAEHDPDPLLLRHLAYRLLDEREHLEVALEADEGQARLAELRLRLELALLDGPLALKRQGAFAVRGELLELRLDVLERS